MVKLTQFTNILSFSEWLMILVMVVLIMSLITYKRQMKKQELQSLSMQSLQRDLRALANAAVGVGGRVLEIERHQRKNSVITEDHEQPANNLNHTPVEYYTPNNQPYEQAICMAKTGAAIDDIVNVCGLSKSEAELVSMMHRLDKAS